MVLSAAVKRAQKQYERSNRVFGAWRRKKTKSLVFTLCPVCGHVNCCCKELGLK